MASFLIFPQILAPRPITASSNPCAEYALGKRAMRKLARQLRGIKTAQEHCMGKRAHRCILIRNRAVSQRILKDFAQRKSELSETAKAVTSTTIPAWTSWRYRRGRTTTSRDTREPAPAFRENYTGVPRLRQWLTEMTLERREIHLDSVLKMLLHLFMNLSSWCQDQQEGHGGISAE